MKKVGIIMGSDSDLPIVKKAVDMLKVLEIPFEVHIYSAHRTPAEARDFAVNARANGFGVRWAELRSPDPTANPYIAFALLIWAGLEGIANRQELPMACNRNLFQADAKALTELKMLPQSRAAAAKIARESSFIREHLPEGLLRFFCQG